jgi:putative SOS response-associated peptidase YedK
MCGRFSLATPPDVLARQFELAELPELPPRYNIAPTQPVAVVRASSGPAPREMVLMRWGLVPYWAKAVATGNRLINARRESVSTTAAFRDAFARRRCLIPADGFFEWRKAPGGKQPYWLHPASGGVWALAGVWDRWRDPDGGWLLSCSIITTAANDYVATLHDRMPAVVAPGDYARWLDVRLREADEALKLVGDLAADDMEAFPVSTRVNRPDDDDAGLLEPTGPALMRL